MNKQTEKIRKQLFELSYAVNAFTSDAVQLIVISRIIPHLDRLNKIEEAIPAILTKPEEIIYKPLDDLQIEFLKDRTPLFIALKKAAATGYFKTSKSVTEICNYLNENEGGPFYPREAKTYLTKMVKRNLIGCMTNTETDQQVFINRPGIDPSVFF
jgi:hypothetical protein